MDRAALQRPAQGAGRSRPGGPPRHLARGTRGAESSPAHGDIGWRNDLMKTLETAAGCIRPRAVTPGACGCAQPAVCTPAPKMRTRTRTKVLGSGRASAVSRATAEAQVPADRASSRRAGRAVPCHAHRAARPRGRVARSRRGIVVLGVRAPLPHAAGYACPMAGPGAAHVLGWR